MWGRLGERGHPPIRGCALPIDTAHPNVTVFTYVVKSETPTAEAQQCP
jgi:hypothetical protein